MQYDQVFLLCLCVWHFKLNTHCSDVSKTFKYGYYYCAILWTFLLSFCLLFSLVENTVTLYRSYLSHCKVTGSALSDLGVKTFTGSGTIKGSIHSPSQFHWIVKFQLAFLEHRSLFLIFDKARISNSYFGISKEVSPIVVSSTSDLQYQDTTQIKMPHQVRHAGACDFRVNSCLKQKPPW